MRKARPSGIRVIVGFVCSAVVNHLGKGLRPSGFSEKRKDGRARRSTPSWEGLGFGAAALEVVNSFSRESELGGQHLELWGESPMRNPLAVCTSFEASSNRTRLGAAASASSPNLRLLSLSLASHLIRSSSAATNSLSQLSHPLEADSRLLQHETQRRSSSLTRRQHASFARFAQCDSPCTLPPPSSSRSPPTPPQIQHPP